MKERGILIETSNPQPEVRKNAETATDWIYREEAQRLYNLAVVFRDRLVDPILRLDRSQVPDPVISFENLRNNNVLASYTLQRNPQGLLHEISLNTAHYQEVHGKQEWKYGRWAQAESLLHEMLHLKQQKYGKDPYKSGRNGHNKEFCTMAEQLGLKVMPVVGCHYQVADADSPFGILMKELGIRRPDDVPKAEDDKTCKDDWFEIGKKRKGRSSLTKYSCGCQNAWIGAAEFAATCNRCGNEFVKATAVREILKELENPIAEAPEPIPVPKGWGDDWFDVDAEIDREQEKDWLHHDPTDVDEWEDLGFNIDHYYA
jgi:hypothetical protein